MSSGKGGKSQIVGYRYTMAVHMGISRGPINSLTEIRAGDIAIWRGDIGTTDFFDIDAPDAFGGDEKEGGVKGTAKLFKGYDDQVVDTVISGNMDGATAQPGWRGTTTLFYYGQIGSNNPYPKAWKMRVNRTTEGWDYGYCWYAEKALIEMGNIDGTVLVTFTANPKDNEYLIINDIRVYFQDNPEATDVQIGDTVDATVTNFTDRVNFYSDDLGGVTAVGEGNVVELSGDPLVVSVPYAWAVTTVGGGSIKAMNPSHIIYECATNRVWGRGLPASMLDDLAFKQAANTLYDENFGLCIRWNRDDDIDSFVQMVINHIGGAIYIDRQTGLLTLKLIRNDYDLDGLPTFNFSNGLLDITDDASASTNTIHNEIVVEFTNPIVDKVGQVRVQNLASYQSLGTMISTKVSYLGIPTAKLALRVAQRDLEVNSTELRRLKLKFDRRAWNLAPAGVFRIEAPSRGIASMVLRVGQIEDGILTDGTITIDAVQDVFGLPDTSYVSVQPPAWKPPDKTPRIVADRVLTELTYYDTSVLAAEEDLPNILADNGGIKIFAKQPNNMAVDYVLQSYAEGEAGYVDRGAHGWDLMATLAADIGVYQTEFDVDAVPVDVVTGVAVYVDDEYMRLDAIDGNTLTVARGVADTIPAEHEDGARVWFQLYNPASDYRSYSIGETVYTKLITRTSSARIDPNLVPYDQITIQARQGKPYPPGDVRVNGERFGEPPHIITGEVTLTWTHRDRIVQGDFLLEHEAASTGPEPGTTYTVRVYGPDGTTLLRTTTGITGTSWTYTNDMITSDGDPQTFWFEVESVRDGFVSLQHYRFQVRRSIGFDQGFNFNFDGII